MSHVSEHEIFKEGMSHRKRSLTLESQNSRFRPRLSGGIMINNSGTKDESTTDPVVHDGHVMQGFSVF